MGNDTAKRKAEPLAAWAISSPAYAITTRRRAREQSQQAQGKSIAASDDNVNSVTNGHATDIPSRHATSSRRPADADQRPEQDTMVNKVVAGAGENTAGKILFQNAK